MKQQCFIVSSDLFECACAVPGSVRRMKSKALQSPHAKKPRAQNQKPMILNGVENICGNTLVLALMGLTRNCLVTSFKQPMIHESSYLFYT